MRVWEGWSTQSANYQRGSQASESITSKAIAVLDWVQYNLSPSQTHYLNESQMKAYSIDLRRKIIDAYKAEEGSYRQLAKRFRVSLSFVQTLLKRYKDTGTVEPLPHSGGRQLKLNSENLALLAELVKEDNDATLDELGEKLSEKTQVRVSRATLGKLLQKLQLTRKKNVSCQ